MITILPLAVISHKSMASIKTATKSPAPMFWVEKKTCKALFKTAQGRFYLGMVVQRLQQAPFSALILLKPSRVLITKIPSTVRAATILFVARLKQIPSSKAKPVALILSINSAKPRAMSSSTPIRILLVPLSLKSFSPMAGSLARLMALTRQVKF